MTVSGNYGESRIQRMASGLKMSLTTIPTLAEVLADPAKVSSLPQEVIPVLRGELAKLDTLLLGRLFSAANGKGGTQTEGDRLLDASEAAGKLGLSKDALYRNNYPFVVRIGKRRRFSEQGIERYIRNRMGT